MASKTPALLCVLAAATLMAGCASTSDVDDVRRQLTERDRMAQQRLAQIESKISNEKLLEMVTQVEQLNAEVARLRGDLDVVNYNQQTMQKRQNDLYSDLDLRLVKLEGSAPQARAAAPASSEADAGKTAAKPADAKPVDEATQEYDRALTLLRNRDFAKAITALKGFADKYPDARQQADGGPADEVPAPPRAVQRRRAGHGVGQNAVRVVQVVRAVDLGQVPGIAAQPRCGRHPPLMPGHVQRVTRRGEGFQLLLQR